MVQFVARCTIAVWLVFWVICVRAHSASVRVTTWNLEWFPNGKPQEQSAAEQSKRINAAADVLRPLDSDILLLQEVRDYDVCARLAEAIKPRSYQVAVCSAFREPFQAGVGKQQIAILAKEPAQAAWSESWHSMEGIDPPRGFAFAWFKVNGADVGVYSVHLKSNLVMRGDKEAESAKNVRKREVAVHQLLTHIREVINPSMPLVKSIIVGGDFNTDKEEFTTEETLDSLTNAGFRNCWEGLPLAQRVTDPGGRSYPDATFDYIFSSHAKPGNPRVVESTASDHLPVTCDFEIEKPGAAAPGENYAVQRGNAPSNNSPETVLLPRDVTIQIPYGTTRIPAGTRLRVIRDRGATLDVEYLGGTHSIPRSAVTTQLR